MGLRRAAVRLVGASRMGILLRAGRPGAGVLLVAEPDEALALLSDKAVLDGLRGAAPSGFRVGWCGRDGREDSNGRNGRNSANVLHVQPPLKVCFAAVNDLTCGSPHPNA